MAKEFNEYIFPSYTNSQSQIEHLLSFCPHSYSCNCITTKKNSRTELRNFSIPSSFVASKLLQREHISLKDKLIFLSV